MSQIYFFVGKLSKATPTAQIKDSIRQPIATQQTQFTPDIDNDANRVEVVDVAYVEAEPDCWLVYAQWKLKPAT
jgi:hypothetical protein